MLFFLLLQSSNDKSNVHLQKGEMSEKQIPDFPDVWNYLTLNMNIMKSLFAHLLTKTAHPQYSISWQMTSKCNFYPQKNLVIIVTCSFTFQVCLRVLLVFLLKKHIRIYLLVWIIFAISFIISLLYSAWAISEDTMIYSLQCWPVSAPLSYQICPSTIQTWLCHHWWLENNIHTHTP